MAKRIKSQVEKIRDQLIKQPYEDVYMAHFARKEMTFGLYDVFLKSFDTKGLSISKFNEITIRSIKNWVTYKYEDLQRMKKFPSFLDYYIETLYDNDGLRQFDTKGEIIVSGRDLEPDENLEKYIQEFEFGLTKKNWWSDKDSEAWMILQRKRSVVKDFEIYLIELQTEVYNIWIEDNENVREECMGIYQKHINRIKLQISKIKLFKDNIEKVPILENLINYIEALSKDDQNFMYISNREVEETKQERATQTLKLNLLHQFGIIEFLRGVWKTNNITIRGMEFLIETLICEKRTSIQPRLSSNNDSKLRTIAGVEKLEVYLKNFGLELDRIKLP